MQKNRVIYMVIAPLALIVTCALWRREQEPTYQGKSLSSWMIEADSGSWPRQHFTPADEAIRQIGTESFPAIRRLLRARDSTIKVTVLDLYYKQSVIKAHIPTQYDHQNRALAACWALGLEAKTLVPEVAAALEHMDPNLQPAFERWLQTLGSDADAAVPALIGILVNKTNPVRYTAAQTLGRLAVHRQVEVVPVLQACCKDTNAVVRFWAREALKELGRVWSP